MPFERSSDIPARAHGFKEIDRRFQHRGSAGCGVAEEPGEFPFGSDPEHLTPARSLSMMRLRSSPSMALAQESNAQFRFPAAHCCGGICPVNLSAH